MNDGIPDDRWSLAEVIYVARVEEAWGNRTGSVRPPARKGYTHNPVADFDLALACAKALLAKYDITAKG